MQMNPQAILFSGTRLLSGLCLEYLIRQVGPSRIAAVLASSDSPLDSSLRGTGPSLRDIAASNGIAVVPRGEAIDSIAYDLIVSVLWNDVFSPEDLERAAFGGINLHPAPLPAYRGSLGRSHAILNGDETFGATTHYMAGRVDRGDVILTKTFPIRPDDTAHSLDLRTIAYSFPLFCETWVRLSDGSAPRIAQDDIVLAAGTAPRFYKRSDIDRYLERPSHPLSRDVLERRYRALWFPPRLTPPEWLVEALRSSGGALPET